MIHDILIYGVYPVSATFIIGFLASAIKAMINLFRDFQSKESCRQYRESCKNDSIVSSDKMEKRFDHFDEKLDDMRKTIVDLLLARGSNVRQQED